VHINQYHSIDIIASTINRIIFWWNPVVTVLNGDIRNNLEYIVDSEMLQNGTGRKHYQYNILNISQITYTNGIANYFNLHNLKKRIKMMNKEKTQPVYKMKWLLLIPVATLILLSFNMKRAIATNVDFVVNSEIFEPEPAPVIEADTLVDKNFKPEELFIRCCDSAKSEPLIIINDNESDSKELAKLTADSIISFSILKEESAIKLFGEKGKNGVVIVMTKGYKNKGISIIVDKKDLDVDTHRLDFSTNSIKSSHNDSIDIIGLYSEEGKSGVIFGTTKDEEASNPRKQLLLESFPDSVLIIIDEKERDSKELQNLNPDTIRSIVIFKNNAAIEGYGEKGKNGVIVIETKESE
jgi:hypothetical protein